MNHCIAMWGQVIKLAVEDASKPLSKLEKRTGKPSNDRASATNWLGGKEFELLCIRLGLRADHVRAKVLDIYAENQLKAA